MFAQKEKGSFETCFTHQMVVLHCYLFPHVLLAGKMVDPWGCLGLSLKFFRAG